MSWNCQYEPNDAAVAREWQGKGGTPSQARSLVPARRVSVRSRLSLPASALRLAGAACCAALLGVGIVASLHAPEPRYVLTYVDDTGSLWNVDTGLTLQDCIQAARRVEWRACELAKD